MDTAEFAAKVFELEALSQELQLPETRVGDCNGLCKGIDEENLDDLCPGCRATFEKELMQVKGTKDNRSFYELSKELLEALQNDKTGELGRILTQSRLQSRVL